MFGVSTYFELDSCKTLPPVLFPFAQNPLQYPAWADADGGLRFGIQERNQKEWNVFLPKDPAVCGQIDRCDKVTIAISRVGDEELL